MNPEVISLCRCLDGAITAFEKKNKCMPLVLEVTPEALYLLYQIPKVVQTCSYHGIPIKISKTLDGNDGIQAEGLGHEQK